MIVRKGLALLTIGFAAGLSTLGCGSQYRPVVSAINPVGPAGQPTKYAVAVSSPNTTPVLVSGYTIANGVITLTVPAPNPFVAGQAVSLSGFSSSPFLNGQSLTVLSTGLSSTQFEASFTHADASSTERIRRVA